MSCSRNPTRAALLALALMAVLHAPATHVSDSIRYVLDSDATAAERAEALCRFAERCLDHDIKSTLAHAASAATLAAQAGRLDLEHDALCVLRNAQLRAGMLPDHLKSTLRSLDLAKQLGEPVRIAADLRELSSAYRTNDRMDKAVEHARMALAISLQLNDADATARAEAFLLESLYRAAQHDQVIRSGEQALSRSASLPPIEAARIRFTIARSLIAKKRFGDAQPHLATAGRIMQAEGTVDDRFELFMAMAEVAIGTKHQAEGERLLVQAEAYLPSVSDIKAHSRWLMARRSLAVAKGDWKSAHDLLEQAHTMADSADKMVRHLVLDGLQMTQELRSNERDRHALIERSEQAEAQLNVQQASNRWLMMGAAILLTMAMALLVVMRKAYRSARRNRMKTAVIERQRNELHTRSLDLQRQNLRLAEALMREERQGVALGEMHHRLKNNLQAIDALIRMQCGTLEDHGMTRVLHDVQGRLRAMALVHATIYRVGDDSSLSVEEHIHELARNVLVAFGRHDRVSVVVDADPLRLHADDLLPLSLILNEFVTNTLKHGISPETHGSIQIVLRSMDHGLELRYSDDGAARTEGDLSQGRTFGMELIQALAAQLNGTVAVHHGLRTTYCVAVAPDSLALRKAS